VTNSDAGSACAVTTTVNALQPGAVVDGGRAIWQVGTVTLRDLADRVFARQGLYVP
jgi:hypothetical protein